MSDPMGGDELISEVTEAAPMAAHTELQINKQRRMHSWGVRTRPDAWQNVERGGS